MARRRDWPSPTLEQYQKLSGQKLSVAVNVILCYPEEVYSRPGSESSELRQCSAGVKAGSGRNHAGKAWGKGVNRAL